MRPLIIAHRGASATAPENSLAACRQAISDGAEGIEFDVRLTADSVPIVFHDETLERIAGQKDRICELRSSELSGVDIGSWFNQAFPTFSKVEFANERIRTLDETLELLKDFRGRIYIELKCESSDVKPLVRSLVATVRDLKLLPRILVKSFKLSAIRHVHEMLPETRTAALFGPNIMTVLRKKRFIIGLAEEYEADELSLHYSLATRRLLKRASERELPVTAWTVNDHKWVKKHKEMGLHAVITNNPKLMLETLSS